MLVHLDTIVGKFKGHSSRSLEENVAKRVYIIFACCYAPCGDGVPPFLPCPFTSHLLLYFTLSLFSFALPLLLSIPSFSARIVPLRFQAGGRRRRQWKWEADWSLGYGPSVAEDGVFYVCWPHFRCGCSLVWTMYGHITQCSALSLCQ